MWYASASNELVRGHRPEIKFRDGPRIFSCEATERTSHSFDPLEVYVRQLGQDEMRREDGWKAEVPAKMGNLPGMLDDPPRFRFLIVTDPKKRVTLLEFRTPAPLDLLTQLHQHLFEENDHGTGKPQIATVSGTAAGARDGRRRPDPEGDPALARHDRRGAEGTGFSPEGWLQKHQEEHGVLAHAPAAG